MGKTPEGKYLYCVLDLWGEGQLASPAAGETEIIRHRDIAAVVRDCPLLDFDGMDEEELRRQLARHQRVNELAMEKGACVPMRFGLIAGSEKEIKGLLDRAYLQFKTALERVRGKAEFALYIHWDESSIVYEIAAGDEEVQRLRDEIARAPAERAQRLKIALGEAVHASLLKRREAYLEEVHCVLRESFTHWALGKLKDDTMIANLAFLVEKEKEPLFDANLNRLGERYDRLLRFKCIGPLPPYSFSDIQFSMGSFELVDAARKRLGLGEEASLAEIKRAYRELAVRCHPDRNPDIHRSAERFGEIVSSYETLMTYCANYRYSFRRETVEGSISFTAPERWAEEGELCAEGRFYGGSV